MDLKLLYFQILSNIQRIDFDLLWKGFAPTKFALYNQAECFFDGEYIEKPSDFVANTAIYYNGEYVAVWNVAEQTDTAILTSKIIHEMFHAYQMSSGSEFPNELAALINYRYDEMNLSVKLYENELLLCLYESFSEEKFARLKRCRNYRKEKFPYEFDYESRVERIEGGANYVEWQALKQLDAKKANEFYALMKNKLAEIGFYFPIRLSNYYSGALYCAVMQRRGAVGVSGGAATETNDKPRYANEDVKKAIAKYNEETEFIVKQAITDAQIIVDEPVKLLALNVYDARRYKNYLTSTSFLMFAKNGKQEILNGNFVIKMSDDETISRVYKWNSK